jgi:hypothetical protein
LIRRRQSQTDKNQNKKQLESTQEIRKCQEMHAIYQQDNLTHYAVHIEGETLLKGGERLPRRARRDIVAGEVGP